MYGVFTALGVYSVAENTVLAVIVLLHATLMLPILAISLAATRATDSGLEVQMMRSFSEAVSRVAWKAAREKFMSTFQRVFCRGRWTLRRRDGTLRMLEGPDLEARARALFEGSDEWLGIVDDKGEIVVWRLPDDETMEKLKNAGFVVDVRPGGKS